MLTDGHIFSIKTKDESNVADVKRGGSGIVITGLNVLRDQIRVGDFVFVVFGGDKPKGWTPGLVALAHISRLPFCGDGDSGRTFRVEIDVDLYFQPSVKREDLVTYPDTFGTIGIGPITKWEPNQAITSVMLKNAVGLLQAICDLMPDRMERIREILGMQFALVEQPVRRYAEMKSNVGNPKTLFGGATQKQMNEQSVCDIALKLFQRQRAGGGWLGRESSSEARYWIFSPGERACRWDEMRGGGVMALSYSECGRDLREYADEEAIRAEFKSSEEDDASYKNHVRALTDFLNVMKPGDLVFAKKGTKTFLGVGRVTGEYEFAAGATDYKHRRAVEWLKAETIEREDAVARKTLTDITRYDDLVRELCEVYGLADSDSNGGATWSAYWELNPGVRQYFDELRKNIDKLDKDKVVEMFTGVKENCKIVFKPMWSGSVGTGWNSLKRGLEEENSKTIDAIRRYCASAADLAVFATKENGKNRPLGFGNSVVSELLMKFHPDVAMKCGRKTIAVYHDLKLMEFKRPDDYSAMEYTKALGIAADIRQRMDQLEITRMVEDNKPADYLTVNEFIAWCGDNKNLIKEKVMSAKMKKPNCDCAKDSTKSVVDALKDDADSMMARLTASLLTKPFVILAGASGTGKSRMVKKLAYMTCRADMLRNAKDETPGNYCMIAVKPNWHDSSELLGYRSSFGGHEYVSSDFVKFILKAFAFPNTPFFVCLDEMNLAPVEQYFAEYLSAVESAGRNSDGEWVGDPLIQRGEFGGDVLNLEPEFELDETVRDAINEKGLYIPQNLFVVGTVNMDDTTNQFSRKVLDRAMTIMMNEVNFETLRDESYEKLTNDLRIRNDEIEKFVERVGFEGKLLDDDFVELLNGVKESVGNTPFEIGYRFAIETALYREALKLLTGKKGAAADELKGLSQTAVDHLALMKVLPRITGTLTERKDVLDRLAKFLDEQLAEHKLSATMLDKMKKAAKDNGDYLSFWP